MNPTRASARVLRTGLQSLHAQDVVHCRQLANYKLQLSLVMSGRTNSAHILDQTNQPQHSLLL
jgi:hypothetical protein